MCESVYVNVCVKERHRQTDRQTERNKERLRCLFLSPLSSVSLSISLPFEP